MGEGQWPLGGYHDLSSLKKIHALVQERFPEGLKVMSKALTVQGERVAVEAETLGSRVDGKICNNHHLVGCEKRVDL